MLMQYMLIIGVPSLINPTEQTDSNQPIKNKEVPQQLTENQTENLVFNVFNCCYVCHITAIVMSVSSKVCGVMLAQHISNPIETERAHPPVIVKLSLVCCRGSVHKKVIPDCNNEYTRFDSDLLCCCAKKKQPNTPCKRQLEYAQSWGLSKNA